MRICIDLTSLADNLSGIERYAAQLSLELIRCYDEEFILVFKNSIHPLFREFNKKNNVTIVIASGTNKLWFNQIKLPWTIHKINADWYLFMAFPVPMISYKKNMVSTIHDICCWDCPETMNGMSKWYFRISHKIAIKKCKAIITISEFSKKRIQERLKYPNDKIWLIYCGIDKNEFCVHSEKSKYIRGKYNLPDEYILSLSTLEPRKNISILINAYEYLIKSGHEIPNLVLAGRKGWKMDSFFDSIDMEVKKKIIFTGFIDDKDLPEVYGNAKLFVFPSLYEGFGMPPLESLACGTPVLSSDGTSLPEILGNAACYFSNNNLEDLCNLLYTCLSSNQDIVNQEIMAQQVEKYNWENEAKKIMKHLKDN